MPADNSITQLVLPVRGAALVIPASMAIKNVRDEPPHDTVYGPRGDPGAIVALRDGSTLVAHPGTPGRAIADWLASGAHEGRFELGGR